MKPLYGEFYFLKNEKSRGTRQARMMNAPTLFSLTDTTSFTKLMTGKKYYDAESTCPAKRLIFADEFYHKCCKT
jgi:hypothetical protein